MLHSKFLLHGSMPRTYYGKKLLDMASPKDNEASDSTRGQDP